ncbi:hypothetical protein [Streptomyces sp. NPDC059398]|uniref:hypothetical protein n=1 Tax=Streptomyces sp. NPDC059398 TaxID=3346820 RepID=UPI0036A2CC87
MVAGAVGVLSAAPDGDPWEAEPDGAVSEDEAGGGEAGSDLTGGPGRSPVPECRGLGGAAGSAGAAGWNCSRTATAPLARTHTVAAAADARTRRLRLAPRAETYAAGGGTALRPADSAACFIARDRASSEP